MNKIVSFILVAIIYFSTGCSPMFPEFIKATSQQWSSEMNNSKGTVYHILFKAYADTSCLKIDSIKISNQKIDDFNLSVIGKSNTDTYFTFGDTVLLSFNYQGIIEYSEKSKHNFIFYRLKNKNRRLKINTIKELKPLLNP
jgi:hypothetical protein